jgi:hypothetical protein
MTESVEVGPASERSSCLVITPSMRTLVVPPSVTAITTRKIGIIPPPVSRKSVCKGDRFGIRNVISNPLCTSPEFDSTLTS